MGRRCCDFGERLRAALIRAGMTQKELADRTYVSQSGISHYIDGSRQPYADTLVRIAEELNVSTDYLLGHHYEDRKDTQAIYQQTMRAIMNYGGRWTPEQKAVLAEELFRAGTRNGE